MQKLESISGLERAASEQNPFAALLAREANLQPASSSPLDALLGKTISVDVIRVETSESIFEVNLTRAIDHSKDFQWAEPVAKPRYEHDGNVMVMPDGQRMIKWCDCRNTQVWGDTHKWANGLHGRHDEHYTKWVPESRASSLRGSPGSTAYRVNRQTQRRSSSGRRINAAKADAI